MPRIARLVVPHYPHHITQRGNRRQPVFFSDHDYQAYKSLLANACEVAQCKVLAYCLMPNHVHLVVVPETEDGLRKLFAGSSGDSIPIPKQLRTGSGDSIPIPKQLL